MSYNELLEEKIEKKVSLSKLQKKKMFGGLAYLVNGNMCFGVYKDELIIRCDPEKAKELLRNSHIRPFDITGKPMMGWLMVNAKEWENTAHLKKLLEIGLDFARGLPAK